MADDQFPQDDDNGSFDNFENFDSNDHFMEEDDFLAADRGDANDLDAPPPKPNLKEIWQQNPSVKIFAGVAFIAVCLISFLVFGSDSDEKKQNEQTSVVSAGGEVNQAPGTQELPPAYEQAVREASDDRAKNAEQSGGSAIPTPIARPAERIEAPVQTEQNDPLSEWRKEAEERRTERQEESVAKTTTDVPVLPTAPTSNSGGFNPGFQGQQQQPQNPPLPTTPTPEQVTAMAQSLQQQMQTIMETQVPKESVVVSMNIQPQYDAKKYFGDPQQQQQQAQTASANSAALAAATQPKPKPMVQAGTIAYGQVITQANSDVPGPVLAEIASGPLMGGRAIGQFSMAQRQLVLRFQRVIKDGVEYPVELYALDPATTLPAVATDIDRHYFSRIVLPAAARFIEGYAQAATQQNSSVVVTNGTVVTSNQNDLDTKQELLNGAQEGANQLSSVLQQDFGNRPITIKVEAGTRIGLLFMNSVFDPAVLAAAQAGMPQGQQQYSPYQQSNMNAAAGYVGQAYNAYNNYTNGNNNGYNNQNGYAAQQQYYQQQQYNNNQQSPSIGTPNFNSNFR